MKIKLKSMFTQLNYRGQSYAVWCFNYIFAVKLQICEMLKEPVDCKISMCFEMNGMSPFLHDIDASIDTVSCALVTYFNNHV